MKESRVSYKNSIGQQLKLHMQRQQLNSAELAKRSDVKTSFIYDVLSGKSANPSPVKLARLADVLGISLSRLVSGNEHVGVVATDDFTAIPRITLRMVDGKNMTVREEKAEPYYFRSLWINERLAASVDDLRMLSVQGDSMQPTLHHGDLIMINMAKTTPSPPGIFVLYDGAGLVIKRLEYLPHSAPARIRIISDNPLYSSYERLPEEMYIIGRAVWFAREM